MSSAVAAADPEFQALARARYAGDPPGLTDIGTRLVVGREAPLAPIDGAALITEAAQQGHPKAWSYLAVLAAAGVGRSQSWGEALDALRRGADLGDADAARQLDLLRDTGIADAADVRQWVRPAAWSILHATPRLATYADFLSPALCSYLIRLAAPKLVRAQVYDAQRGVLKSDAMRTSTSAAFSLIETDVVTQLIRARIACAAGVAVEQLEPLEVLHYAVGERFKPHVDFFHPALPHFSEQMRVRGQRISTCLVYLNEDYDGGETDFPRIGVKFRGRPGEALVFGNVRENGAGDMNTLHEGLAPTRGEKWLLSQWIRSKLQPIA